MVNVDLSDRQARRMEYSLKTRMAEMLTDTVYRDGMPSYYDSEDVRRREEGLQRSWKKEYIDRSQALHALLMAQKDNAYVSVVDMALEEGGRAWNLFEIEGVDENACVAGKHSQKA